LTADGTLQLWSGEVQNRPADPKLSLRAEVDDLHLDTTAPGGVLGGVLSGRTELGGTLQRPVGWVELSVPSLGVRDGRFQKGALRAELTPTGVLLRSLAALLGDGSLASKAELHYDRGHTLDLNLDLQRLPLRELPGVKQLSFALDGRLGGKVRVIGPTQPLAP